MQPGDIVDEDITCNSEFMLDIMPRIGMEIREKYHWVPRGESVYLVMDNAGGHGTDDAKLAYTEDLLKWKIVIIWQIPMSPATNMLDLGVWMTLESAK
jgi:hypothetical protein